VSEFDRNGPPHTLPERLPDNLCRDTTVCWVGGRCFQRYLHRPICRAIGLDRIAVCQLCGAVHPVADSHACG
jgi:hypothetical protein